jgi:hypothetical protein
MTCSPKAALIDEEPEGEGDVDEREVDVDRGVAIGVLGE